MLFLLILLKIFAIYFTEFGLYGDEAQYWLWSKQISWGYFSKPPLIAWLINLSNQIFGDYDYAIRILAPIIH